MPEDLQERTEQATPRKRQEAREKGQVARSRELISISAMAGIFIMFYLSGNALIKNISILSSNIFGFRYGREPLTVMRYAATEAIIILLPFLGMAVVFSLFAGFSQGGFILKPLNIEVERLNPINGLKRIFSLTGLGEFLKSMIRFVVGGVLIYFILKNIIPLLPSTIAMDLSDIQIFGTRLVARAMLYAFGIYFVLAVIDYIFERWKFERSLKMTREEIKKELKESEGDPLIKARIKSIQREIARRRMMQEVPKATVVITNPTHIAVALRYDERETSAPVVIAKGENLIAEKIKEIAKRHNIPIVEDKPLARELNKLEIGSAIPVELYKAVAKILAYIYRLKGVA